MRDSPQDLPQVVREIVSALLEGDWTRYADDSGKRFYYIIRERDHSSEAEEPRVFQRMLLFEKPERRVYDEWYIRSALAEEPPDRLSNARRRAVAAGLKRECFDAVMTAVDASESQSALYDVLDEWMPRVAASGGFDALDALFGAVRIEGTRKRQVFVSDSDRPELRRALEARFLKELVERFPKAVNRASEFNDWLSFSDPQLREAVRCYLYGFFRAAVMTGVAALEAHLKKVSGRDWTVSSGDLVSAVFGIDGVCGPDETRAASLRDLFKRPSRTAR